MDDGSGQAESRLPSVAAAAARIIKAASNKIFLGRCDICKMRRWRLGVGCIE